MTPTAIQTNVEHLDRIARQHLATDKLLGVDFVPIRAARTANVPVESETRPFARVEIECTPKQVEVSQSQKSGPGPIQPAVGGDKLAALEELRRRHDRECPHCTTCTSHTQTVFGEGNPDAELMFVGEAPGAEEDRTGRPFVGRAGQKLDDMITAMGLARSDVYIANVLKSRPLDNRTPLQSEVELCGPYLAEQIRIIEPKAIVTLGGPATKLLLNTTLGITRLRGVWSQYIDPITGRETPVMPTFHPAYLLRAYTPENRKLVWSDMQAVMQKLGLKR